MSARESHPSARRSISSPRLLSITLALAALATAWTLLTVVNGPLQLRLPGGTTVTTSDPARPALFALLTWSIVVAMYGWSGQRRRLTDAIRPHVLAIVIAVATFGVGVGYATTAASGADALGYVSQADRWIEGDLRIDQAWASPVPWPMARWTFNQLGYRPANVEGGEWILVPVYSPGLPLMMAAAKLIGGQEAMFWIVPLSGAVLVLITFAIGRRLSSPAAGLAGAWLLATSPTFLFMLMAPMTDIPVAAAWAVSFYFLLDRTPARAAAAGLAAGLAIVIRPNLVAGAAVFGLWYLIPLLRGDKTRRQATLVQGLLFSIGVIGGSLFIAAFNQTLNGSPFISSYGSGLAGSFSSEHFWPNAARYISWLVDTQTPFVLAGAAALVIPWRRLWPAADERLAFVVIGLFVASLWLMYFFYAVFEEWWFLRFVLASWPFLMVGCGAIVAAVARGGRQLATVIATAAVIALGVHQVQIAADRNAFNLWKEERRYVTVARHVRAMTDRTSVVFSMQHSGSLRYYGGRVTMRYDAMEPRWFDRTVEWLADRGIRAYLLVDDWELPGAAAAMEGQQVAERLNDSPLLHYRGTSQVYLFDLSEPRDPTVPTTQVVDTFEDTRSAEPVTFPPLDLERPAQPLASRPGPDR